MPIPIVFIRGTLKFSFFVKTKNYSIFVKNLINMKSNFKLVLTLLVSSFVLFSCSKSSDSPTAEAPVTPTAPTATGDYWPTAVNNRWTYSTNGVVQTTPSKIVSVNVINSLNYYTFNAPVGATTQTTGSGLTVTVTNRIRKNGGDYYFRYDTQSFTSGTISGTQSDIEFIILKDYLNVGQTWNTNVAQTTTYTNSSIPAQTTNISYAGTIIDKIASFSINGTPYPNVIKVKILQTATPTGQAPQVSENFYWFAKDVGLIKVENSINGGSPIVSFLTSYTLN